MSSMSRTSRNEEAMTPIESASQDPSHDPSHDQNERKKKGSHELDRVSRTNSMKEAARANSGEYSRGAENSRSVEPSRGAEEASKMPARHPLPPRPDEDRRGSTHQLPGVQYVPPGNVSIPSTARPTQARQVVTRSPQDRGWSNPFTAITESFSSYPQSKSRSELRLEKDYQDLSDSHFKLEKQNSTFKRQIGDLHRELQIHTSRTESYIQDMKEREKRLTEEIHELKAENETHEYEIQQAQRKSFRNMKQGRWLPQEERSVQGKLELLQSNIKQWAKSHAMKSMKEVIFMVKQTPAEQAALLKGLSKVVRLVDDTLPPQLLEARHAPFLCLNAMLANAIYMHILADPFFFMEDDIGPIIDSLPADSSILKQRPSPNDLYGTMYDDLMTVDAREAHVWRSQMLRILSPSTSEDAPTSEKKIKNQIEKCRRKVCSRHADSFLEGPGRHLLQITKSDAPSDRSQRLENIFQTAGKLSCQLWTQRTYFRCLGLTELQGNRFSIDSPIMELHPLIHLDEAPAGLNGHPITMVVNPLVQVWGTDEAEDYDLSRVWAKAVVWLPLES